MEKILINENRSQAKEFERSVIEVRDKCNFLVDVFHSFQSFRRVTSLQDFVSLVDDPLKDFDQIIISSVDLKAIGNVTLNPQAISDLLNINRDAYIGIISGKLIKTDGCQECKKLAQVKKGEPVITLQEYRSYAKFLTFESGKFGLNKAEIKLKQDSFAEYIQTDEQARVMQHFQTLVTLLNQHYKQGYCNTTELKQASLLLKFRFVDDLREVFLNDQLVYSNILKVK